jgi:GAF domain-containing protein
VAGERRLRILSLLASDGADLTTARLCEVCVEVTTVELADTLVADFDVVDLLTLLTDGCVDVLDVGAAGLMLAAPAGDLRVMASSSQAIRMLELFELQAQEGPCLDCYRTGEPVVNQDLASAGGRWPRFAAEALAAGFASVHALPMRLRGAVIGALNLFHIDPGIMRPADIAAAQAMADVATIAVLQHRATVEAQIINEQLSPPSTAESSSSRPKACFPNAWASTWIRRSASCAAMLAITSAGSSTSPRTF